MINKGKVISLKKIKNVNFFVQNKIIILMCFLYIIGVLTSVAAFKAGKIIFNWDSLFYSNYLNRYELKFFKIFLSCFFNYLTFLVFMFIFGTSIMGVGLIPFGIFVSGFVSGGIASFLYSVHSIKGIAFNTLIIMPVSIIFFIICFFAAKLSLLFALDLSKITFKRVTPNIFIDFRAYCNKYLIFVLLTVFVSLLDAVLSSAFIKLFKF